MAYQLRAMSLLSMISVADFDCGILNRKAQQALLKGALTMERMVARKQSAAGLAVDTQKSSKSFLMPLLLNVLPELEFLLSSFWLGSLLKLRGTVFFISRCLKFLFLLGGHLSLCLRLPPPLVFGCTCSILFLPSPRQIC